MYGCMYGCMYVCMYRSMNKNICSATYPSSDDPSRIHFPYTMYFRLGLLLLSGFTLDEVFDPGATPPVALLRGNGLT